MQSNSVLTLTETQQELIQFADIARKREMQTLQKATSTVYCNGDECASPMDENLMDIYDDVYGNDIDHNNCIMEECASPVDENLMDIYDEMYGNNHADVSDVASEISNTNDKFNCMSVVSDKHSDSSECDDIVYARKRMRINESEIVVPKYNTSMENLIFELNNTELDKRNTPIQTNEYQHFHNILINSTSEFVYDVYGNKLMYSINQL